MKALTRAVAAALITLSLASTCIADHRFQSGPYTGFTKLEPEKVIVELPKPLHVAQVSGIVRAAVNHEPIKKALVELRDDSSGKVKGTRTDAEGRFVIKRIANGRYTFKATRKGFQSVVGILIVREKAPESESITIDMPKAL